MSHDPVVIAPVVCHCEEREPPVNPTLAWPAPAADDPRDDQRSSRQGALMKPFAA